MKAERYKEEGHSPDEGPVSFMAIRLEMNGLTYSISVATPEHIRQLKEDNRFLPTTDVQINDNILPLENVSNLEIVRVQLEKLPLDEVKPFLIPVDPQDQSA